MELTKSGSEELPKTQWEIEYEEEKAFCKLHNLESYQISRCKFCRELMKFADLKTHRAEVHDKPLGIERHTAYYCGVINHGSQINLIEPYGLSAERREASTGSWGSVRLNEEHVYIQANDQDVDQPPRMIGLYITKDLARKLIAQLQKAVED